MRTQFDITLLDSIFESEDNYIVENASDTKESVIIFFSGNGLYYPNSDEEFKTRILNENRYEWRNLNIENVDRKIFVRDIKKTWYVNGINETLDSIEKVVEKLKELIRGYRQTICIGNSAGGYAAVLFGCMIGAQYIFSISGQFSIWEETSFPQNKILNLAKDNPSISRYFDLRSIVSATQSKIIYIFPILCAEDAAQYEMIKSEPNVQVIAFSSSAHGVCAYPFDYKKLLSLPAKDIERFVSRVQGKTWNRLSFSINLHGCSFFGCYLNYIQHKLTQK